MNFISASTLAQVCRIWLRRIPLLRSWQHGRDMRLRYPVETALLKGTHHTGCSLPSVIHYTFNKAASQYVMELLSSVAEENGMAVARLSHFCFHSTLPYFTDSGMGGRCHQMFRPQGYLYTSFAGPIEGLANAGRYKHVVMVRDPRDILVSNYYSISYSHAVPDEHSNKRGALLEARQRALKVTVDEFSLGQVHELARRFTAIEQGLLHGQYPVHLCSYEEMVGDFPVWLSRILDACGLKASDQLFQSLVERQQKTRPVKENKHAHLRKGQPGDFREKLSAETVRTLNEVLQPVLRRFGYSEC